MPSPNAAVLQTYQHFLQEVKGRVWFVAAHARSLGAGGAQPVFEVLYNPAHAGAAEEIRAAAQATAPECEVRAVPSGRATPLGGG